MIMIFSRPDACMSFSNLQYSKHAFLTLHRITCGLFINITLYDYLRTIVNLNRSNSTWCLVSEHRW